MYAPAFCSWRVFGLALLVLLLGMPTPGRTGDLLQAEFPFADNNLLHLPRQQWVRLAVDVEEYHPVVEYTDHSSSVTRSLAILPGIRLMAPDRHFQPYIGAGLGLSISGYTPRTAVVPLPLGVEENLVFHAGGGVAYHLSPGLSLMGSARFVQFTTTDVLSFSSSPIRDGLDFSAYTVEVGIRLAY